MCCRDMQLRRLQWIELRHMQCQRLGKPCHHPSSGEPPACREPHFRGGTGRNSSAILPTVLSRTYTKPPNDDGMVIRMYISHCHCLDLFAWSVACARIHVCVFYRPAALVAHGGAQTHRCIVWNCIGACGNCIGSSALQLQ